MYEVILKNGNETEKLHEMASGSNRKVSACQFTEGINSAPSAQIVIYPQHPAYNHIEPMVSFVEIVNTKTGNTEFEGRVLKIPFEGMDNKGIIKKQITCEGFISYLYDSVQQYQKITQTTSDVLLQRLIQVHNAQFPEGAEQRIDSIVSDMVKNLWNVEIEYNSTFSEIKRLLLDEYGGELSVKRNAQGKLVLYWMETPTNPTVSRTTIELAKNISAISIDTDATHIITRLFPYGSKIVDAQTGEETGERVSIIGASYSGGVYDKAYIDDAEAIAKYGIISATVIYDEISDPTGIYQTALAYMQNNNRIRRGYAAQVLDLSTIGLDPDALEVGIAYRFKHRLIGLDDDLRLIKKTVDIYKPYMPTVEIGDKSQKITASASRAVNFIEYELPKQKASFLEAAQEKATSLITNATKGYIYVDNERGELLIMDNPDKNAASKVWRWNSSGFGYSSTGYNGTYSIAMTMDNSLVADFIMAATIIAQDLIITGGKIDIVSSSETNDRVSLSYSDWRIDLSPLQWKLSNSNTGMSVFMQAGGLWWQENGNDVFKLFPSGAVSVWTGSNWVNTSIQQIASNQSDISSAQSSISSIQAFMNNITTGTGALYCDTISINNNGNRYDINNEIQSLKNRVSALEGN